MPKSQILNVAYMSFNAICENKIFVKVHEFTVSKSHVQTVPRRYFFCGSFMFFSVLCLLSLCARLFICGWERTDLLAIVCGV